jgi:hypothetical protein
MSNALKLQRMANPRFDLDKAGANLLEARDEKAEAFSIFCEVAFDMLDDIEEDDCTEAAFDTITEVKLAIGTFAETD